MVVYMTEFGNQGYFLNTPSKFLSADGMSAWLWYSAGWDHSYPQPPYCGEKLFPGGRFPCYGLVMAQMQFLRHPSARPNAGVVTATTL